MRCHSRRDGYLRFSRMVGPKLYNLMGFEIRVGPLLHLIIAQTFQLVSCARAGRGIYRKSNIELERLRHPLINRPTDPTVAVHLQVVRRTEGRGFLLIPELLFGQIPKFLVAAFRPSSLLPELMGVRSDFFFRGFCHVHLPERAVSPRGFEN